MLRSLRLISCGALGFLVAASVAWAAPPAERGLLGVRLWRDYASVLKLHGEPTRVVPGEALPPEFAAGSLSVGMQGGQAGRMLPGAPGMGTSMGMMGPPAGPMMGGMMAPGISMPGGVGGPPMLGRPGGRSLPSVGGGGMAGLRMGGKEDESDDVGSPVGGAMTAPRAGGVTAPSGMAGSPGMPPMPGMFGTGGMTAPPSYAGGMGMLAGAAGDPALMESMGMGARGIPGAMGSAAARSQAAVGMPSEDIKETWVYEKGKQTIHFMFNRDGRVVRIRSFGTEGKGATSRSVALGDPVSKVYEKYGWADATIRSGDSLTLDYSHKAHVVFDLVDRRDGKGLRVVGITIAPSEGRR